MIKAVLAGYYIGNYIQLEINTGKIINVNPNLNGKKCYVLRNTMLRLLIFLIETKGKGGEVTDEEIFLNVWDKYGLQSSVSRLWQVMQSLKYRLILLGVSEKFITRVKKGYLVETEIVKPFYFVAH